MIKISCTKLEQARNNPRLFGQLLATEEEKDSGGQHGMFAYMKDAIRQVHAGIATESQGLKVLHNYFLRFNDNPQNRAKQQKLAADYLVYHKKFALQKWEFLHGRKNINWLLHEEVGLTGHTPWVFESKEGFIAYYLVEAVPDGWRNELRFPLIQQYLADRILHCPTENIKIGYYILNTAGFDFDCFDDTVIDETVAATKQIFKTVHDAFNRSKKVFIREQVLSGDPLKEYKNE